MSTARQWSSCIALNLKFQDEPGGPKVQSYVNTGDIDSTNGREIWNHIWTTLEENPTYKKLAQEIMEGGLVAYLTTPEDKELKKPISRIHMPRYEDAVSGKHFILTSNDSARIYGKPVEYFVEIVKDWVNQHQAEENSGYFDRKASNWIEGTPYEIFNLKGIDEPYLKKALDYYLGLNTGHGSHLANKYAEHIVKELANGEWKISDEFWSYFKDLIFSKKVDVSEYDLQKIFKRHPDKINYRDIARFSSSSEFFGRVGMFGGYNDDHKKYQQWATATILDLAKKPINKENFDLMLDLARQNRYDIDELPTPLKGRGFLAH